MKLYKSKSQTPNVTFDPNDIIDKILPLRKHPSFCGSMGAIWRNIDGLLSIILPWNHDALRTCIILLIGCAFTLSVPLASKYRYLELYWIPIVTLFATRLTTRQTFKCLLLMCLGVILTAGAVGLILYLDTLGAPISCLYCWYKPYIVGLFLAIASYIWAYWSILSPDIESYMKVMSGLSLKIAYGAVL